MGQKVNPIANRLGIIKGWDSNWFGGRDFSEKLVEDDKIRKYLNVRLAKASISKIIIERTLKLVTVTISTARPGIIIGKGGQEVDKLKEELRSSPARRYRSTFSRLSVQRLMQLSLQTTSHASSRAAYHTVALLRQLSHRQCVWAQRVSRFRFLAV